MKRDSLTVREAAKIPFEFQRDEIARTFRQVVVAPTVWHNYLPHQLEITREFLISAGVIPAIFMSRMLHDFFKQFQWLSSAAINSMQHERDMEAMTRPCALRPLSCRRVPET